MVLSLSFLTVCGLSCVVICSYVAAFVANKDERYHL